MFEKDRSALTELRDRRGLALNTLARRANVSVGHLSKVERHREPLTWNLCQKLGPVLGISPFTLLVSNYGAAVDAGNRDRIANAVRQMSEVIREPRGLSDGQVAMLSRLTGTSVGLAADPIFLDDGSEDWKGAS